MAQDSQEQQQVCSHKTKTITTILAIVYMYAVKTWAIKPTMATANKTVAD
jgi:hypothetical protein